LAGVVQVSLMIATADAYG